MTLNPMPVPAPGQASAKPGLRPWVKMALAGMIGGAAVTGGQRLTTDSPIHFAVEGNAPEGADAQWVCLPEGGIIGAPMVCRPKAEVVAAAREAKADREKIDSTTETSTATP